MLSHAEAQQTLKSAQNAADASTSGERADANLGLGQCLSVNIICLSADVERNASGEGEREKIDNLDRW
jgi:hypothetical protein